jgi:hypothetical protein
VEYVIARLERGRDLAAAKRHRGLTTGKAAKGWNAKPRELSDRQLALRGWDSDRDTALAVYTRLVFPGRHHVPELDGFDEPTIDDVIRARQTAERDALLATF